jgi:hypothetical protein
MKTGVGAVLLRKSSELHHHCSSECWVAFHDADGGIDVLRVWRMLRHDVKGQCLADLGQDWILWGRVIVIDIERTYILDGPSPFPVHTHAHFSP